MTLTNTRAWALGLSRRIRELATIRERVVTLGAVAASLQDGSGGIRAVRRGCYTLGEMLTLGDVVQFSPPPSLVKRYNELEPDTMPWTGNQLQRLRGGMAAERT